MYRTAIEQLIDWKKRGDRKPLIINGARQVGKTWLLKEFARLEYRKMAYVFCRKNDTARTIFKQLFDPERILRGLSALTNVDITPGDTLIVLDEVQDIPEAIEALKSFREQLPQYHIAVAGSLLGLAMHEGVSFPVGNVNEINLYPMTFEEFLLAIGEQQKYSLLMSKDYGTMNLLHGDYVELLRQYYFTGGMPEAVAKYAETRTLQEVRRIQHEILDGYDFDFSKHAPADQVPRIRMVWHSMPSQLFKENKKFIYGVMRKGARAREYELAVEWLADAGLVYKVPRVSRPALPLKAYEDASAFKLYMLDVGLLSAMADVEPAQILVGDHAFTEYKGGMTEQYVLQQMMANGLSPIYYHTADDSRLEIDFLLQHGGLLPIEVKAEGNVRANSLTRLLHEQPDLHALRISMLPYREQEQLTNVPLYSVGRL